MDMPTTSKPGALGLGSMALAAAALLLAVAHLSLGPFVPQKPIEDTIVETAVKIKEAAARAVTGAATPAGEPSPQSRWNVDRIIDAAVLALAAVAILLSLVSLFRAEPRAPAFVGFSLGAGVLMMAWLQWLALIVCGAIILVAIINNLDEILS